MIKKYSPQMVDTKILIDDIRRMIDEARSKVAAAVNTGLTMLHWHIGKRINEDILDGSRAKYGKQILATLSQELSEGGKQTIELLRLDASGIHVAEYLTELPPRIELKKKLQAAIEYAKNRARKSIETETPQRNTRKMFVCLVWFMV
jgi:hypothetical protein